MRLCFACPLVPIWAISPQKQKEKKIINRTTNFFLVHFFFLPFFNSDWYDEISCVEAYDDSTSLMYMVMKGNISSK